MDTDIFKTTTLTTKTARLCRLLLKGRKNIAYDGNCRLRDKKKLREIPCESVAKSKNPSMKKQRVIELAVKVVVAALTAFLTALGTTSCMGAL